MKETLNYFLVLVMIVMQLFILSFHLRLEDKLKELKDIVCEYQSPAGGSLWESNFK